MPAGEKPGPGEKRSLKDAPFYGIWEGREDIGDGVEYVNRMWKYRREPQPEVERR